AVEAWPYEQAALDAARLALAEHPGPIISEQTVDAWLKTAYATEWGREWEARARQSRDAFDAEIGRASWRGRADDRDSDGARAPAGIRAFHVTGVQTCALPIWPWRPGRTSRRHWTPPGSPSPNTPGRSSPSRPSTRG